MNAVMPEPSALHRAALVVHALPQGDAGWVLQALSSQQRQLLHPLLADLRELAIPQDPRLLESIVAAPAEASVAVPLCLLRDLDDEGVRALALRLAAEPPRVVAIVIAAGEWPWRDRLLRLLPQELAAQTQGRTSEAGCAPALAHATLSSAVRDLRVDRNLSRPPSAWSLLYRRLVAWRTLS